MLVGCYAQFRWQIKKPKACPVRLSLLLHRRRQNRPSFNSGVEPGAKRDPAGAELHLQAGPVCF
jgi:hypothetical protein